jgi:acrylyl-CoA reductase (NADPH)
MESAVQNLHLDTLNKVLPFILRAVTLAGIDSVNAPQWLREQAWTRLATDLDLGKLASTVTEIGLAEVLASRAVSVKGKYAVAPSLM